MTKYNELDTEERKELRAKHQSGIKQVTIEFNRPIANKFKGLCGTFETSMAEVIRGLVDVWIKEHTALLKDMQDG